MQSFPVGVVYLRIADLEVQLSTERIREMSEEFSFEDAVDERVGLLWRTNTKGKPVVFQVR